MAYTNNVPQGNQQIATTQPIIQANFGFLQTSIGTEHNFNALGIGDDTYHLKCSMPNQADPGSLPAGTNGQYYVNGGLPKFYNGTASFIQLSGKTYTILTGTVALTTSATTVTAVPANTVGTYWIIPTSVGVQNASAQGTYVSSNSTIQLGETSDPGITVSRSGLNIQARVDSSGNAENYKYLVMYFTP